MRAYRERISHAAAGLEVRAPPCLEPAVLPGMQQVPAIKELTYRLLASRIRAQTGGGTNDMAIATLEKAVKLTGVLATKGAKAAIEAAGGSVA